MGQEAHLGQGRERERDEALDSSVMARNTVRILPPAPRRE